MLLAVAPNAEEAEKLRRTYAKGYCFVYLATYRNFVNSAKEYRPDVILLALDKVTPLLEKKVADIREFLPDVKLVTLGGENVDALAPDFCLKKNAHPFSLVFQAHFHSPDSPNAALLRENRIVGGLLLCTYQRTAFLYGDEIRFSPEEIFLLYYLSEIHPKRADVHELGRHCFAYGSHPPRATVASRISRINKRTKERLGRPIIKYFPDEGYGFSF